MKASGAEAKNSAVQELFQQIANKVLVDNLNKGEFEKMTKSDIYVDGEVSGIKFKLRIFNIKLADNNEIVYDMAIENESKERIQKMFDELNEKKED